MIKLLMLPPFLLALLAVLLASCPTKLTPLPPENKRNYQSLLEWSRQNAMPGAILLVRTPKGEFVGSVGEADSKRHVPMRTNHAFRVGSITKMFLGIVAAQMHAEGKLDLDASITNWLAPDITCRVTNANRMTLRQLLHHTSGIYSVERSLRWKLARGFFDRCGEWPATRDLSFALGRPASFAPGEGWEYSNTGYLLAGLILDRVSGQHHGLEIRQRILNPLHLTNTFYEIAEPTRGQRAHGYEDFFNWWRTDAYNWTPGISGASGLVSTVPDLVAFIRAVSTDTNWVNSVARRELFSRWTEGEKTYSLGMHRTRLRQGSPWFIGHSGATLGYHSFVYHQPERDITIVYFGSSTLFKVRGFDRTLSEFMDTFCNALFEQALKDTEPASTSR